MTLCLEYPCLMHTTPVKYHTSIYLAPNARQEKNDASICISVAHNLKQVVFFMGITLFNLSAHNDSTNTNQPIDNDERQDHNTAADQL